MEERRLAEEEARRILEELEAKRLAQEEEEKERREVKAAHVILFFWFDTIDLFGAHLLSDKLSIINNIPNDLMEIINQC